MFSTAKNPYTELIVKATDEKQTSEDWGVLLNIWEKVNSEGETGARNCVAAIVQRLQHRNANVQLFSLTLANALVQNCGKPLHREIASKTFTDTLKRLTTDRNTHDKVKQRAAGLVKEWAAEFEKDETLGIMSETYDALRAKGVRFEEPRDEGPPPIADSVLKREEEELQRAIAESEREAKQRQNSYGNGYQPAAGPSTSQKPLPAVEPASNGPYPSLQQHHQAYAPAEQPSYQPAAPQPEQASSNAPTRVRALYDFDPDPDQPGELPLRKGDVIRVIDSAYQEWWRGQLNGRVGIFPVTYVEVIPEPTPDMLLAEAQYEASVFSQAGEVDRLLAMLQNVNPETENVGDNDELSDLYQKCLMLRPKVLKLVEKYTTKKNELLDINSRFMSAKADFEARLDDSWRQHQASQAQYQGYGQPPAPQQQGYPGYAQPPQQPEPQYAPQHQLPPKHQHQHQHPPQHQNSYPPQSAPPTAQQPEAPPTQAPNQPQPYYDAATNQWYYPPGFAEQQAPQQQYAAAPEAPPEHVAYQQQQPHPGYASPPPPTAQFGQMSIGQVQNYQGHGPPQAA